MNSGLKIISVEQARIEDEPWSVPVPFDVQTLPTLDLSKAIPPGLSPLREFCAATAESLQVPLDAVAPLALSLASAGTARAMEVQLLPQWRETAPLWFLILAEPGERKSALLSLLAAPLHEWQVREHAYLGHAIAAHRERRCVLEARRAGVRDKIRRSSGPNSTAQGLEREALELTAAIENLPPLEAPELITANATPEAIRELLLLNGEKVALVSAETDPGQLLGTRYTTGGAANIDLFLAAFTGDPCPSHRVDRRMLISRPALSMSLCVQPAAIIDVLRDPVAQGRGFVDRLCIIQPASRLGTRVTRPESVPAELVGWWRDAVLRLMSLPWPGRVVIKPDGLTRCEAPPHVMHLSPQATEVFDALRGDLESRIGPEGELRAIAGFVSKLPGVVARIALTLEALQDTAAPLISGETMCAACEWAPFLIGHFSAAVRVAAEPREIKLAKRLRRLIARRGVSTISACEALHLVDGDGLRMDELEPALQLLVDFGHMRAIEPTRKGTGRPPSQRYAINPAVLEPKSPTSIPSAERAAAREGGTKTY